MAYARTSLLLLTSTRLAPPSPLLTTSSSSLAIANLAPPKLDLPTLASKKPKHRPPIHASPIPLAPFLSSSLCSAILLGPAAVALAAASASPESLPTAALQILKDVSLADLDPAAASIVINVLGPIFASFNLLFIVRIVMSWYPQLPVEKFPLVIAFAPTEPLLAPTRNLIPPVGGVDVAPVIWVAIISFLNEVLLGQQGLLVLLSQQQG